MMNKHDEALEALPNHHEQMERYITALENDTFFNTEAAISNMRQYKNEAKATENELNRVNMLLDMALAELEELKKGVTPCGQKVEVLNEEESKANKTSFDWWIEHFNDIQNMPFDKDYSKDEMTVQERFEKYDSTLKSPSTIEITASGLSKDASLIITPIFVGDWYYIYYKGSTEIKVATEAEKNDVLHQYLVLNATMMALPLAQRL